MHERILSAGRDLLREPEKVVDFVHLGENHFERLVMRIFGSNKTRTQWPISKKAKPLTGVKAA